MTDGPSAGRLVIDVPWSTIGRLLLAVLLVWLWLHLWRVVMVLLVAVVLAVTLDPIVAWLENRGWRRGLAASLLGLCLVTMVTLFLVVSWSSLQAQGRLALERAADLRDWLSAHVPMIERVLGDQAGAAVPAGTAERGIRWLQELSFAAVTVVLGFILTIYLLIDGRRTYRWVRAFVPERWRPRVDRTMDDTRRVVFAYFIGNVVTSVFAAAFVFASLSLLHVPAAFVLALLAGVFDFVPVLGFVVSAAPAILLAAMVSATTALVVALLYALYHGVENYLIAPKVYGRRLELSDTAVLLALAVGAELGGVVGALLALPFAAAYPTIERIWLHDLLGREVLEEHERVQASEG